MAPRRNTVRRKVADLTPQGEALEARRESVRARILLDILFAAVPLVTLTLVVTIALDLPRVYPTAVGAGYAVLAWILSTRAPDSLPHPGMGWANRITLFRATLTLPVAGFAASPGIVGGPTAWWAVAIAGTALALDGVDGAVARSSGTATTFGARFDMELDAFLILVLSWLAWTSTPVGAWVLGIGLLRYAFVAAGALVPRLRGDLPPSPRRKIICVVQSIGLLVVLAPPAPTVLATGAAGAALVLLLYSFAVDTRWLLVSGRFTSAP